MKVKDLIKYVQKFKNYENADVCVQYNDDDVDVVFVDDIDFDGGNCRFLLCVNEEVNP